MKLPTNRTAVASIKRSNQWPKPKNLSDSINYLGTLGLNDESSEEISHTNCDKDTKNIFFELFIYLCWLAPLQFQPKSHPTQEAARSTTFETPLSALLKIIYPESWD